MTATPSRQPDSSKADHPESVGRYRIIRRLGEGGMGSVFLARDGILRREVALKLPLNGTEDDPEVRERFLREARAVATLDHPYICRVYDADEVDGRLYLAMAYIEGETLADLARAEGLPPRQVVALVGKLAIALHEAHARGVVHRDLKPRNVMIRAVGSKREPVIVDFGLARLEGPEDVRMTRTGQIMGTPAYMAPEQLKGDSDAIGPRCDIYALGVILYELVTGRLPFVGPYPVMMAQILTQAPLPPSVHRPGLDPALDAICLKAMAREIPDRHTSMMELASALTDFLKAGQSVEVAGKRLAPVTPLNRGDSIPTGADTLVSRFLNPAEQATPPTAEDPRPAPWRKLLDGRPPWQVLAAAAALGLALLAAVIVIVTNNGEVTIEVAEPASVAVDGSEIRVTVEGEPVVLRAGEHSLEVKWKDGHFETRKFAIRRGETTPLVVNYRPKGDGGPAPERARTVVGRPAGANEGWTSLFDGKDLAGWKLQPGGSDHWKVEQGAIVGTGPMGFLFSERGDYANFHARIEASCDSKGGGGFVFRSAYFDDGFLADRGFNVQISANPKNTNLMGAMAGNRIEPGFRGRVEPGEWFTMDVIAVDNHITVKINGETSVDYFTPAGDHARGHFALRQNGGAEVRFRKVEVRELPSAESSGRAEKPADRLTLGMIAQIRRAREDVEQLDADPEAYRAGALAALQGAEDAIKSGRSGVDELAWARELLEALQKRSGRRPIGLHLGEALRRIEAMQKYAR